MARLWRRKLLNNHIPEIPFVQVGESIVKRPSRWANLHLMQTHVLFWNMDDFIGVYIMAFPDSLLFRTMNVIADPL